ncbi:hypothetical protein N4G70_16550 [Streptomyces sp. ASQP_92]|uniref:Uncharacterized protein n=1 Tax=Streptomyces hundungensis TaxID=1077946 RepID=A0A387HH49_9ACTN|nr:MULTISPECIES: hypothetical protein [Streptomyces]AYG82809.1 hypothetical protein DWB77_04996 [Streptomyces hundungensis]MCT9090464.1 hypothetical protein [Streptomyces sp. ASQP_92]
MHSTAKHTIIRVATTGVMLAAAALVELRLMNAYSVPMLLALPCGLAVGFGVGSLVEAVTSRFTTTVYRCTADGCTYKVRVTHVDPVERRRWQEAAASHPSHELNYRP